MFEAKICYSNGREHRVEAADMKLLYEKCKSFIENENVLAIYVYKIHYFGYFKNPLEKK